MAFEIIKQHITGGIGSEQTSYIEAACLSSDTKPTDGRFATGSICVEVDTGSVFFYNATGKTWVEQFSFQG